MMRLVLPAAALAMLVVAPACSPAEAFCAKDFECREDDDDLDSDHVPVCVEQDRAFNDVLAANEEQDCRDLRYAKDAYLGCMAGLDCDDFNDEQQNPDKCEDEAEEYGEALQDAANDCFVITAPNGQD